MLAITLFLACAVQSAFAQNMMERWNSQADGVFIPFPWGEGNFNLLWDEINNFPYPTYKGGSYEAYQKFAEVFADFFEAEGNFDYMKEHNLLTYRLIHQFRSGQIGMDTTFKFLASDFSTSGFVSEDVRARIKAISEKITAATKKD